MNPQPKTVAHRNRDLLDMAEGKPCLLLAVSNCETRYGNSTVACHSNFSKHGKSLRRKADDEYSVWGCAKCHYWLDNSSSPKAEKVRAFEAAHLRQIDEWRKIVHDYDADAKDRRAAHWALKILEGP
jgi:hypothetical protein